MHVTGIDGKRHRQGDSGRTCVFKEVMGCSATHPPWHCKVFGKLPAKEREKLIKDNRLCPFCPLHDKDKPCGAMEESEEAWELVEEEMMIVGTVQQEDDCSWQDASKPWVEQDEEIAVGIYQVGTCQSAGPVPTETEGEAAKQSSTSQRKEAEGTEDGWQAPRPSDLLLEGEEGEYFLELLMRKALPERPKADRLTGDEEDPRGKTAPARGKDKKKNRKKALKEKKAVAESGAHREEKSGASLVSNQGKQAAPDLLSNPEAKGRGLTTGNRAEEEPAPRPRTTPRGECSGQKMPDS